MSGAALITSAAELLSELWAPLVLSLLVLAAGMLTSKLVHRKIKKVFVHVRHQLLAERRVRVEAPRVVFSTLREFYSSD